MRDAAKCTALVQAYIDDIFKKLNLGPVPIIKCEIVDINEEQWKINTNINLDELNKRTGVLGFRKEMPLIGEVQSNRLIWTAQKRGYDLFLGNVMSQVVGNKLQEAEDKSNKSERIITDLKSKVEFPDIWKGVNDNSLSIEDVLDIRKKAGKFRERLS